MSNTEKKRVVVSAGLGSSLRNFRGSLIEAFILRGYEVHATAPRLLGDVETLSWLKHRGVVCHDIPIARASVNPINDLYAFFRLIVLLKKVRPQIYIGYTIKPVIWGLLAAGCLQVPKRVALITGLGYSFTGKAVGKRALVERIVSGLYSLSLRCASQVFFQNPDDLREFRVRGILPVCVPATVLNGSGVDLLAYRSEAFPLIGEIRFLLIARLLVNKGIREYVSAAAKLRLLYPNISFHLVGGEDPSPDGLSEREVRGWSKNNHVIWHGALADVRSIIAASHVYVLPSYREGTPRTVLEAMAMGRPIITTDAPGCRETVVNGENGFMVPVGSVEKLVEAMERFIREPGLIARMGRRSREIAENKYDVHKVNKIMLQEIGVDEENF